MTDTTGKLTAAKALELAFQVAGGGEPLAELRRLGFDVVAKRPTRAVKGALVLADGCKVKIDPNVNPDAATPEHVAELESFHAFIHALQQARREQFVARPAGTGITGSMARKGDGEASIPQSTFAPKGYGERAIGDEYRSAIERYLPDGTVIGLYNVVGKPVTRNERGDYVPVTAVAA
jgi:hypothetical protein